MRILLFLVIYRGCVWNEEILLSWTYYFKIKGNFGNSHIIIENIWNLKLSEIIVNAKDKSSIVEISNCPKKIVSGR